MKKPVILIGGASGTGKSTLANRLLCELGLDHRLGTGFIRAVVQAETTPVQDLALFSFTFQADDPAAHIRSQTERLKPHINACIERARKEGTSLVIEGAHLLPEYFHDAGADAYLVLKAPPAREHRRRVLGETHAKREITDADFRNIQAIDRLYMDQCGKFGINPVVWADNLKELKKLLI